MLQKDDHHDPPTCLVTGRKTASCMLIGILLLQADGESKSAAESKAVGRPRLSSTGHVYAGLSDEEVEVSLNLRQTMSGTGLGGIQNITSYNGSTDIPSLPHGLIIGKMDRPKLPWKECVSCDPIVDQS